MFRTPNSSRQRDTRSDAEVGGAPPSYEGGSWQYSGGAPPALVHEGMPGVAGCSGGPEWVTGHVARSSYRVEGRSPSPTYTSDGDTTLDHKARYYRYALWVGRRWFAVVHFGRRKRVREWRMVVCLTMLSKTRFLVPVVKRILSFLPSVSGTPGRRLPRYNRYGILDSPREAAGVGTRPLGDPWDDYP